MADCIKLLPDIVANQIKAGEVVETPSSVVKEMMENSIDAEATEVTVNYVNGGRDLIQIIDNGRGMSPVDARMAFERHATSKILSLEDIYSLHTFGFRGEALASIAAVAQVELVTRTREDEVGTKTLLNGGEFVSQVPVAASVGSQFAVRNIFYNTPVRRKFINNNESTLASEIKREFRRVALCHPEVACNLLSNGAPIYQLPASSLVERIVGVMGITAKSNLLEVEVKTTIASINGFVGRPDEANKRSGKQYMFVNGRYFYSPQLHKAIMKAYDKLIPDKSLPSYFIYLTVDPDKVDVNIHAKKTEVKFADAEAIWQILNAAVRETLAKTGAVPMMDFAVEDMVDIPVATTGISYAEPRATTRDNYNPFTAYATAEEKGEKPEEESYDFIGGGGVLDYTTLSDANFDFVESGDGVEQSLQIEVAPQAQQVSLMGGHYAVATLADRVVIVDLARVREGEMYAQFLTQLMGASAPSQRLLFAERLTLSHEEYDLFEENAVEFATLGFDVEMVEGTTIDVVGIPANVKAEMVDRAIYDLLQSLQSPEEATSRAEVMARRLAHSDSVRRTQFGEEEALRIVNGVLESGRTISPLGKPFMVEISAKDVKNRLG